MSFSHTDIYHDREKKNCAQVKTSSADTLVIKRELGSPFDKWVETEGAYLPVPCAICL